jgi:hypothetical protein
MNDLYKKKLLLGLVSSGSLMLDVEYGRVPYFDPFKPYGNKDHYKDAAEILGDYQEESGCYMLFDKLIDLNSEDWLTEDIKLKIDDLHKQLPSFLGQLIQEFCLVGSTP